MGISLADVELMDSAVNTHGEQMVEVETQPSMRFLARQKRIDR